MTQAVSGQSAAMSGRHMRRTANGKGKKLPLGSVRLAGAVQLESHLFTQAEVKDMLLGRELEIERQNGEIALQNRVIAAQRQELRNLNRALAKKAAKNRL